MLYMEWQAYWKTAITSLAVKLYTATHRPSRFQHWLETLYRDRVYEHPVPNPYPDFHPLLISEAERLVFPKLG